MEKNVAPRVVPTCWLARTVLLCFIIWIIINLMSLFLMVVPLPLGRALFAFLHLPKCFHHDPLRFLVGCVACSSICCKVYASYPGAQRRAQIWNTLSVLKLSFCYEGEASIFCIYMNGISVISIFLACARGCVHYSKK